MIAIVGAGAAMIGLIEHAHEPLAPAGAAWLLAGSVGLLLVALAVMTRTLADYERHADIYRPLAFVMVVAAVGALLVGWWQPAAWLLALLLVAILAAVWLFAVVRLFKTGTWTAS
jgi:CHASE2 domain-containing sensor protein